MEKNLILDTKLSESLKGKLIICKYTNSEGYIDIGPIPYDSYFIRLKLPHPKHACSRGSQ